MAGQWEGEGEFAAAFKEIYRGGVPVASSRIEDVVKLTAKHYKTNYKMVVHEIERFIRKSPAQFRLAGLYILNEACRYTNRKFGDKNNFTPRAAKNLEETVQNVLTHPESIPSAAKVVGLWRDNGIFEAELCAKLVASVTAAGGVVPAPGAAASSSAPPPAAAAAAAADQSASLLAMIRSFQTQPAATPAAASARPAIGSFASAGSTLGMRRPAPVVDTLPVFDYGDDVEDEDARLQRQQEWRLKEERRGAGGEASAAGTEASASASTRLPLVSPSSSVPALHSPPTQSAAAVAAVAAMAAASLSARSLPPPVTPAQQGAASWTFDANTPMSLTTSPSAGVRADAASALSAAVAAAAAAPPPPPTPSFNYSYSAVGGAPPLPADMPPIDTPITVHSSTLWVGDISSDIRDLDLYNAFAPHGAVIYMRMHQGAKSGAQHAFIKFGSRAAAEAAKAALDGAQLRGCVLRVAWGQVGPRPQWNRDRGESHLTTGQLIAELGSINMPMGGVVVHPPSLAWLNPFLNESQVRPSSLPSVVTAAATAAAASATATGALGAGIKRMAKFPSPEPEERRKRPAADDARGSSDLKRARH